MALTTAVFVPLILASGLTRLRLRTLIAWAAIAAMICAVLAWYDIDRDPTIITGMPSPEPRLLPSLQLWLGLSLALFVAHTLLIAAAHDRRAIARYPSYFAAAWSLGLQAVLAALFAGLFALVLWLGSELFRLIKIDALNHLLRQLGFWTAIMPIVLCGALHVTDLRIGLVRGLRSMVCNLLAWLLPLLAVDRDRVRGGAAVHRAGAAMGDAACREPVARRRRDAGVFDRRRVSGWRAAVVTHEAMTAMPALQRGA